MWQVPWPVYDMVMSVLWQKAEVKSFKVSRKQLDLPSNRRRRTLIQPHLLWWFAPKEKGPLSLSLYFSLSLFLSLSLPLSLTHTHLCTRGDIFDNSNIIIHLFLLGSRWCNREKCIKGKESKQSEPSVKSKCFKGKCVNAGVAPRAFPREPDQ